MFYFLTQPSLVNTFPFPMMSLGDNRLCQDASSFSRLLPFHTLRNLSFNDLCIRQALCWSEQQVVENSSVTFVELISTSLGFTCFYSQALGAF